MSSSCLRCHQKHVLNTWWFFVIRSGWSSAVRTAFSFFFFIPRALLCILLLLVSSVQTTKCAWERGSASVLVSWYYHEAKAKSTLKTRAKKEGAASLTHAWRGRKKWHVCSEHATDNMAAELCTPEKPCLVLSLEENDTRREILTVNYDVE